MSAILKQLEVLHELVRTITTDPVQLYEVLRTKELYLLSEGHPDRFKFANLDGQSGAEVLAESLKRLAAALDESAGYFRTQLVADYIANSPDNYLP